MTHSRTPTDDYKQSAKRRVDQRTGLMMAEEKRLLVRPSEAAAMLSVSRTSIYELIAAGTIPAVRVGRMLRVPLEAQRKIAATQAEVAER